MFWSDLGSAIGFEAIGLVDASLPTVAVFAKYNPLLDSKEALGDSPQTPDANEASSDATKPSVQTLPEDCPPSTGSFPEKYGKGVVFYMKDDRIVGILLWNVFNRISIARKVLMSDDTFKDLNEVAKLFDIFEAQQDKQN